MQFDTDFTMTIDGRKVEVSSSLSILNPATEQLVAQAPDASAAHLDAAVTSARRAFPAWSSTSLVERKRLLGKIAECLQANAEGFKNLLTLEQGKPHADSFMEVMYSSMWFGLVAQLDIPIEVREDSADRRAEVHHVPLGVVGAIVPWNFPILLAVMKIAPALLAGNTVVLKPAPTTPLTALKLGELLRDVLPPGVLNVISGGDSLGPAMTAHGGIDKISFTGSTQTGRKVMQSAAATLKRVTLELGGNDPAIVMPDVDVGKAAPELFWAAFRNNSQFCLATKRMFIHEDIYEPMKRALTEIAQSVKIGNGAEEGVQLGPIQNRLQFERVKKLIEEARSSGLTLIASDCPVGKGYFVPVTLVDNPPDDSRVVVEEAFGPVLPLLKFKTVDEVVERANASEYGLGASIWSANVEQAYAIGQRLHCGTVWINEIHYQSPFVPFGGHKQSGIGAENGVEGLLEYTNAQTIYIRKTSSIL
ncbi:MAG: Aldehyde Dehydrogenase [Hydrocarboniphaga sp.]|uniref:aldehyde dehydrogenase family protein n=1 Tax=Hydrocarboniphaga sp. TaxID=2033016 RepID=UPI00261CC9EF|nr:aldehyde dehydrogenase family protein [Hydrocarboniphaga sp.]MDB5967869.1 Aldehyde Dehydrogenase [Hydrocarboniphaga sp.]